MSHPTMGDKVLDTCIIALEHSIDVMSDYIKTEKPPKTNYIYSNLQLAKSAKRRLENQEANIRLSELRLTHAALLELKKCINETERSSNISQQDIEEIHSMRNNINQALKFLKKLANSFGCKIDDYM